MHKFKLERFEGPLDLLLKLIEGNELSITEVSLSEVTEQYLNYLDQNSDLNPEEMADFLVVAARLLLLKSRVLLPTLFIDDNEEDTGSLAAQLALYRLYIKASKHIIEPLKNRRFNYSRAKLPHTEEVRFSPPESLNSQILRQSFEHLLSSLEEFVRPAPDLITRTVSLKEKIKTLRSILDSAKEIEFSQILGDAKTRTDVIISFLALLELVKQRYVVAKQDEAGSRIVVSRIETEEIVIDQFVSEMEPSLNL